ncbi:hypothetical protein GTO10_05675 [Candidatus Saccharibacteria bacterium]|nr:hypothetical protein [Candidatus Saccharibacteria bacterium]
MIRTRRPAFTLFEIILVLGIVVVMSVAVAPSTAQLLSQSYFTNTVERVTRTLRTAQIYSISGKEDSSWGVHYESSKLVLFKGTSFGTRDPTFDVETPLPATATLTGWTDVYFDRLRGTPSGTLSVQIETLGRVGFVTVGAEGAINRP